MYFALKLGFAAVTAGLTWAASQQIHERTHEWEGKAEFYDHIECNYKEMANLLRSDNGHIKEVTVWYKGVSGSMDVSLASLVPFDHIAVILETDHGEFWNMEKNSKVIHIQKSDQLDKITSKLGDKFRDGSLKRNIEKEEEHFKRGGIDNKRISWNILKDQVLVNDVLKFIISNEVSKGFSLNDHCQSFVWRTLASIKEKAKSNLFYYDYPRKMYINCDVYNDYNSTGINIQEIKWLYIKLEGRPIPFRFNNPCIGLLVKTHSASYWTIEYQSGDFCIQHSNNAYDVMSRLFGKNRNMEALQTLNSEERMSLQYSEDVAYEKLQLFDIFKYIKNKKLYKDTSEEVIKSFIYFVYRFSEHTLALLTIYDHSKQKYINCIDMIFKTPDDVLITNFSVWSKSVNEPRFRASGNNCLVIILETNDNQFWRIERATGYTLIQMSMDMKTLKSNINNRKRGKRDDKIKFKTRKAKDLLELMLELHRECIAEQCEDSVKLVLQYLEASD